VAWREKWPLIVTLAYVMSQLAGAACGAWLAHAMFDLDVFQWSDKVRTGFGQWLAEFVATTCLLGVILLSPPQKTASLVAAYIGAAYWFTASTSFANPAAVFGRMMSNSFAGIAPSGCFGIYCR
jgi:glycerol uptake facilitator-like aquaporin